MNSKTTRMSVFKKAVSFCVGFMLVSLAASAQIAMTGSAKLQPKQPLISVNFHQKPLPQALHTIANKINVGLSYKTEAVPSKPITYKAENVPVYSALDAVLKHTKLYYSLSENGKVIIIKKQRPQLRSLLVEQSDATVSGTVTNAKTGKPLIGVTILVVGTSTGTTTDAKGHYSLTVPSLQDTLRFSYIGYKTKKVPINGRTTINVTLKSSVTNLNQLVVLGFGQAQKKGVLTSSVSVISEKQLEGVSVTSPGLLLQGQAPGVRVVSGAGGPGTAVKVRIRGTASISGGKSPLYVINGVPIITGSFSHGPGLPTSALSFLNPNNIKSITILKDASATAIYGARAANGVVLIQTKSGAKNQPVKIDFNTYFGITKAVNKPDMVTGTQFEMLMNEAAKNNGKPIPYPNPQDALNTNWVGMVFRPGFVQNYNLSFSGGSDNITYSIAGSHMNNKGILISKRFKKTTGSINLSIYPMINGRSMQGLIMLLLFEIDQKITVLFQAY